MKDSNSRKALACIIALSAVGVALVSVILWLVIERPYCMVHSDDGTDSIVENVKVGLVQLRTLDRLLIVTGKSDDHLLQANLGVQLAEDLPPTNCSDNLDKICLQYENYTLQIATVQHGHMNCETVKHEGPMDYHNITDCWSLGASHWFGGAEIYDQEWPVEKWNHNLQEFIPGDAFFPGNFGGVLERYWLSSAGVALFVPDDIPLHVSINETADGRLCFVSKFQDSPYRNINNAHLSLVYQVCHGPDLRTLHASMAEEFWARPSGAPHIDSVVKPIWSTWAVYKEDINDSRLIEYAEKIVSYNFSIAQLEIDDDWTPKYGDWTFNPEKFPDVVAVVSRVKALVPALTVWVHPFINYDAESFKLATEKGYFITAVEGGRVPALTGWWQGIGGLLDFSYNETSFWYLKSLKSLQDKYQVDSFKFDAGETNWLPKNGFMRVPYMNPSDYVKHYVNVIVKSDMKDKRQEVRIGCRTQHAPILVRMMDRSSNWGYTNGLRTLIPTALTFGLLGYPYVLPDMIGGNAYEGTVDKELYIRWLQVNVFLPAIQFSIPPWQFEDPNVIAGTIYFLNLRESYRDLFVKLTQEAIDNGWPMVRPLWWICPEDEICQTIDDEYLLGSDLLVAPVVEQGMVQRDVYIPSGTWEDMLRNEVISSDGGLWIPDYEADLMELPYFIRLS